VALREQVFAVCLGATGRPDLAEDALQETFFAAHRALPSFRGEARISTWIYRIALRAALRERSRARTDTSSDGEEAEESTEPESAILARDQARRIAHAAATLPQEQLAVITLFAVDGLSHPQIAEILSIPEGTVWSRLHHARKKLAAILREQA
jgi:RNA polymerase sigma-70 factor (ECF subfamily)